MSVRISNTADESGIRFDVRSEGSDDWIVWSKIYGFNVFKAGTTEY